MAEIEEAVEVIEGAEEGIEAESEGLEGEELEEVEAEAKEAAESTKNLGKVVENLKTMGDLTSSFVKFVIKNAAIGAILYGVTVALKKLTAKDPSDKGAQQKYAKVKSISEFIKSASGLSQKVCDWLKKGQSEMITLDGIQVPLISIFVKYTTPLANAADKEMKNAKPLMQKTSDGKTTPFLTPDASQVSGILTSGQLLVDALRKFQDFAAEKTGEFPILKTLPLTKDDVDGLQQKLDVIKSMPF